MPIFDEKLDEFGNLYLEYNKEKFEQFYAEFKKALNKKVLNFRAFTRGCEQIRL